MSESQIPISKNVASVVAGVHPGRWVNVQLLGLTRIRTSLFSLVLAAGLVAGLGFVRYKMLEQGPTCGGQRLGPGDECINLDTGLRHTAADQQGALMNQSWFWAILIGAGCLGFLYLLYRRFVPNRALAKDHLETAQGVLQRLDADIALVAGDAKISRGLHEYRAALLKRLHSSRARPLPRNSVATIT